MAAAKASNINLFEFRTVITPVDLKIAPSRILGQLIRVGGYIQR